MKSKSFFIIVLLTFACEMVALIFFAVQTPDYTLDVIAVNEAVQSVTKDFQDLQAHINVTDLDYTVLDKDGNLLYKTRPGLSETLTAAVSRRDTVLDIEIGGETVGKIIIGNNATQILQSQKQKAVAVLSAAIAVQCGICVVYIVYLHAAIITPFRKLKSFAQRIAGGNLDIPLEMDRRNLFGVFTESFDIMRSELKKARLAEARANVSKKELVAKLSHDIKTPVASIKAVSEVGLAVAENEKDRNNYGQIIGKADQINTLVSDLFTATLEELQQLSVVPADLESSVVRELLCNADYLHRAAIPEIPDCLVCIDKLRLQQVFDNIFVNSYKYADTKIIVGAEKRENMIAVTAEDYGGGVSAEELPLLTEKFKRGSNARNKDGAGLGLYISEYFMREMGGGLTVENGKNGLKVTIRIRISGKN